MQRYVFAALAAASLATPALAQEAAPFTGARVEGLVGWDRVQNDGHKDGVAYGVAAGYDMQWGGAVLGVEGEVADSSTRQRERNVFANGDRLSVTSGRDLYIGARVGTVVGGNTLLYAKAGYTNARLKVRYDDGTAGGNNDFSDAANADGVRVGAGAEYAIGPNSFVKAEYRYSNYEGGFERHQALAGFGFRF